MTPHTLRTTRSRPTTELYCRRSTAAIVPLDRLYGRLTGLVETDAVDSVDVTTWPGRVTLSESSMSDALETLDADDDRERAVRTYDEFETWADEAGVSLEPGFSRERYESSFTGESGVAVRFPVLALAVRDDSDDLLAVYPHQDERTVTVDEGVERLAASLVDTPRGTARTRPLGE